MDKKVVALASDVAGGPIQEVIIHDPRVVQDNVIVKNPFRFTYLRLLPPDPFY